MKIFARLLAAHALDDPGLVMLPENAKEAKALLASGWPVDVLRQIFTGRPCTHGHVAPRRASGYCCIECDRIFAREYSQRPEVREHERAKGRVRYRTHPPSEEQKAQSRDYQKEYRKRPDAAERHRKRMLSVAAERRAATPPWLTDEHRAKIRAFYDEAIRLTEATGILHEVDHIIPLTHPEVCGWHVPWNLQVLTSPANRRKSNKFDGTLDNDGWRV